MRIWLLAYALGMCACSAGPYGFSRTYSPTSAESDAVNGAVDYDPVMATRAKSTWKKNKLSVFGVVRARKAGTSGFTDLTLSVRSLLTRNLCDDMDEDTCRVSVSEHEHAMVHVRVKLNASDTIGQESVGVGSLLRVVGNLTDEVDAADGSPVVRASFYRHWPSNFYVTDAARAHMLR